MSKPRTSVVGACVVMSIVLGACDHNESSRASTRPLDSERRVKNQDVELRLTVRGPDTAGHTLVLLHGGPGISSQYMSGFADLASDRRRVINYDQRGVGASTAPAKDSGYSLDANVADLEALRGSLGVERLELLGHSWGGLLAMAYAAAHPDHVERLVLVSSTPATMAGLDRAWDRVGKRLAEARARGDIPAAVEKSPEGSCAGFNAKMPAYFDDKNHPAAKAGLPPGSSCHHRMLQLTWENTPTLDLRSALEKVHAPILVIEGASDPFAPMSDDLMADLAPVQPKRVILEKCGHAPWIECPERFWPHVRAFLP